MSKLQLKVVTPNCFGTIHDRSTKECKRCDLRNVCRKQMSVHIELYKIATKLSLTEFV